MWVCGLCTFQNNDNDAGCSICAFQKVQFAVENKENLWVCPRCTFHNGHQDLLCIMCNYSAEKSSELLNGINRYDKSLLFDKHADNSKVLTSLLGSQPINRFKSTRNKDINIGVISQKNEMLNFKVSRFENQSGTESIHLCC
jgi:hypothetical protein